MAAYPGRDFRIGEVINYVKSGRNLTHKSRRAVHVGVFRVMKELEGCGSVIVERKTNGAFSIYRWKTIT